MSVQEKAAAATELLKQKIAQREAERAAKEAEKEAAKEAKKAEKEAALAEKKAEKEAEKAQAKAEREAIRAAKAAEKAALPKRPVGRPKKVPDAVVALRPVLPPTRTEVHADNPAELLAALSELRQRYAALEVAHTAALRVIENVRTAIIV
jgi:hypothetical protein